MANAIWLKETPSFSRATPTDDQALTDSPALKGIRDEQVLFRLFRTLTGTIYTILSSLKGTIMSTARTENPNMPTISMDGKVVRVHRIT